MGDALHAGSDSEGRGLSTKLVGMNRRQFVQTVGSVASAQPLSAARGTALCLNEDNSHWFFTRAGQTHTKESVAAFVDQYAETQVRELVLSGNSQRTSFASKVWDPIWKGYDPDGPDDQPLFRSTTGEGRVNARKWVHTAWSLAQQGIDPYAVWIERARRRGLSPWISMRMNDLHNVDDPDSYMHSTFWRQNPQFRRLPWRAVDWRDRAFDFAHEEVRAYHFRLVEEYLERYDVDGLELDWMRFGFHFSPGRETEGGRLLTEFVRKTRRLADSWAKRRGHKIGLGARVPSRPQTAIDLGLDGALWAREGLIDLLVFTPFWASAETDMPVELWRRLAGDRVTLAAGLELLLRPYPAYRPIPMNSIETVRGAAASLLERGADRVYLFNYMDSQTQMPDAENYPALLHECGRLQTLAGKARRHVVTYADTSAPGEPSPTQLPQKLAAGQWAAFRVHCGPALQRARVRMELEGGGLGAVRVNGQECSAAGAEMGVKPGPERGFMTWTMPGGVAGRVVIDVQAQAAVTIHWVEIAGT